MCIYGLFSKLKGLQVHKIFKIAIFYLFQKEKNLNAFYFLFFFFLRQSLCNSDTGMDRNYFSISFNFSIIGPRHNNFKMEISGAK